MPVRFLSDAGFARLGGWLDVIAAEDLVTFFTLTGDDLSSLASKLRVENRLGAAVQLCALSWLGWIPDDLDGCRARAVVRLGDLLALDADTVPRLLAAYRGWKRRTRRDHGTLVLARLGWRTSGPGDRKQLDASACPRWSMALLVCHSSWRAIGCAANGSVGARRWTRCHVAQPPPGQRCQKGPDPLCC